MDQQRGRPVLVEFWDFCRVNSLRTLPYLKAWHERYADDGLRVIGVHTGGFAPARDEDDVRARGRAARDRVPGRDRRAARDLGPLRQRGLAGALPVGRASGALYSTALRRGRLRRRPSARSRSCSASSASRSRRCAPRTTPGALLAGPDRRPARRLLRARTRPAACGRCSTGAGELRVNGRAIAVDGPGCYRAGRARRATRAGVLELEVGDGRRPCHATCFTPGVACQLRRARGRRAGGRAAAGRSSSTQDRGARPVGRAVRLAR